MSANGEKRLPKSPGGDSSDLFGAEFLGSPCHHRVLKPPGGGTSDIFGGSEAQPAEKSIARKNSAQTSSIVLDDGVANAKPVENGHSKADAAVPAKPSQPVSNGHAPAAAAAPRARVPPGGFSSGLW